MSWDWDSDWPAPHRDDDAAAARWRGELFRGLRGGMMWRDEERGYITLPRPNSVTFPICTCCDHVIWDWPHFEEKVPHNAICDECAKDEER
jgi:hypothetical protein